MGAKGDHSNGKVMTSLFYHFLTDTLLKREIPDCLAADQSRCAVSERAPTVAEIASRKAAATSQGKGDPLPCETG